MKKGEKTPEETKAKMRETALRSHRIMPSRKGQGKTNDALTIWRMSGGQPWNKGKKLKPLPAEHREKISNALRGEKGYWWKGGRVSLNHSIRRLFKFRDWRKLIYERDNYTCQICGLRGRQIEADHIKKFSLILDENKIKTVEQAEQCEELWNTENGRTLCLPCHKTTDTYGARGYFINQNNI
jgi:hypothetical protein